MNDEQSSHWYEWDREHVCDDLGRICTALTGREYPMNEVIVVIGAGSIGQAIARRVCAGKMVLIADLHLDNADKSAEVM
jgi:lactate dehydrogenase-like 2-hydroxyacid dehydrogenase